MFSLGISVDGWPKLTGITSRLAAVFELAVFSFGFVHSALYTPELAKAPCKKGVQHGPT